MRSQKVRVVNVLSKPLFFFSILFWTGAYAESLDQIFASLRALPSSERIVAFDKRTFDEKKELFFVSNERHPPYSGLDQAIAEQGVGFLSRLRSELINRGGTPEVLDFLGIVNRMKRDMTLTYQDINNLNLNEICRRASRSNYCPVLLNEILKP